MLGKMFNKAMQLASSVAGFATGQKDRQDEKQAAQPARHEAKAKHVERTMQDRALYVSTRLALGKSFFSKKQHPAYRQRQIASLSEEELDYAVKRGWVKLKKLPRGGGRQKWACV